jgi:DNA-directed RNA polymerase specialized sigma24 family protein
VHQAPDSNSPPPGELADWEIALARLLVYDFLSSRTAFPRFEADDLMQECLLHWWSQRQRYKETKGASKETFMRRVVKAKLIDIERTMKAGKRGGGQHPLSLDAPLSHEAGQEKTLGDTLPAGDTGGEVMSSVMREHLLLRLAPGQRRLALGLEAGMSMSEISKRLDVPRTTLYDERRRIEKVFRDEGLEEFLR